MLRELFLSVTCCYLHQTLLHLSGHSLCMPGWGENKRLEWRDFKTIPKYNKITPTPSKIKTLILYALKNVLTPTKEYDERMVQ